jgi:hypothetical protein
MLRLQTPQTGEEGKEEEISCCGALVVNEFLMLKCLRTRRGTHRE